MCWNPGPLLEGEAWVEPERRWPSLSEPQSLYLRGQASSGRTGTAVLVVLLQLWVSYGVSRSLAWATALLSWSRGQGHGWV